MCNKGEYFRYINTKTFATILLQEECLDNEDLWNIMNTDDETIHEKVKELNKDLSDEEIDKKIDNEDEDYIKVMQEIIKNGN